MTTYYSTHTGIIKKLGLSNFCLKTVASTLTVYKNTCSKQIDKILKTGDIQTTRKNINKLQFNNFLPVSSKELPKGSVKDCVYFLFHDTSLMKIGKVGGGDRCVRQRALDYRSVDWRSERETITDKINEALKEPVIKLIHMYYIDFKKIIEPVIYGMKTTPVYGPILEKKLISKAYDIGYKLPWNEVKG